jgi:threonine/homoserine/homoserine lactone efflux protein
MKLLFAGFVLSLFGSLPPGLISLTVAYSAIRNGIAVALVLAAGAACAEFFQAWAAVVLSDWFLSHPSIEQGFKWAAFAVFTTIGVYLFFFAKAPKAPQAMPQGSWPTQFGKGVLLSTFNLLAVPYWFAYCGWLRVEGWWEDGLFYTLIFSFGVTLGTMFSLALYAWLGLLIVERSSDIAKRANQLIGLLFLGLGIKLLAELLLQR